MAKISPPIAPWRSVFLTHIGCMDSPLLSLSTVHLIETLGEPRVVPRCRTVVFRGMWAGMSVHPNNTAELNPCLYESDLLTITIDTRMEKTPDFFRSTANDKPHSGGGGLVEAVFWAPEARTQWRIRGRAYMIGPNIDSNVASPIRNIIGRYMRRTGEGDWSWSRELTAHFGNLSPGMRGSFRNPPPGTPRSRDPGAGLGLGQKVDDLQDEFARRYFRVVIIVPEEVDQLDLKDPSEARRWNYKFDGSISEAASWKTTELWP
ncbi:unnamed protein product [Clonostachys solani]|uniref:Pyridoxamine 5'-phosphate oxidase Alr4036 family FMN-binding domain-containing protein n=1 Tax=Clonostachys solani TaxID=160281 RepID=A0A9N9ZM01_9HYPO|nr:unnamed protein product [Clonostachys solani]